LCREHTRIRLGKGHRENVKARGASGLRRTGWEKVVYGGVGKANDVGGKTVKQKKHPPIQGPTKGTLAGHVGWKRLRRA